jgi:SAM-dependent methyltransferase
VLDVACGSGRHSRFFRDRGCNVVAVDRDAQSIEALSREGVEALQADIEAGPWPFAEASFDAIIVTHYLHRPLFASLCAGLKPAGFLIYETFGVGNEKYGRPSNPAFLLKPGELLEQTRGLQVLAYEHGYVAWPKPAVLQRICAVKTLEPVELPAQIPGASGGALG